MKILLVSDQFFFANNGVTISARRFAKVLEEHGHEVKVLSVGTADQTEFPLKVLHIPIFDKLVTSQGMTFAKVDKEVILKAVKWADFVHLYMPFFASRQAVKYCMELGIPFTGAFHVQPENVTSSIHMGNVTWANDLLYRYFKWMVFQYCHHIHCPSNMIANQLRTHNYKAKLHVISNGIDPDFVYRKIEKNDELKGKFCILTIGRYSIEKRQDVLIDAVSLSKYSDKIQIIMAGQGPRFHQLEKQGEKLKNKPVMRFFTKLDLLDMIAMSDLYVHAADAEIEAMACMEAFAGGLVPIIAESPKSATPQFSLDEHSLFPADNVQELANRIDWWIEHEEFKKEMEKKYADSAFAYSLDSSVRKAEEMFNEELERR